MATAQDQVNRMKRELRLLKDRYDDLALELQEKENQLLRMEDERNRYRDEMTSIRSTLTQTEKIINQRVEQTLQLEKFRMAEMQDRIIFLEGELRAKDGLMQGLRDELERKDAEVEACEQKLRELMAGYDMTDALRDIKEYRDDKIQAQKTIQELTKELNKLSDQMEDLAAENSYLRELAQVPDNYGIIQDIKLNAKQKNEDYIKLIRELEDEREEREREIAELRQKNLRMTTLYNRVGSHERYKGLTLDQLNLVDQYVLNLKDGKDEYPLNDRSKELRAENERLKAQIEVLETKHLEGLENFLMKKFSNAQPNTSLVNQKPKKVDEQILQPEALESFKEQNEELYNKLAGLVQNLADKLAQDDKRGLPAHSIQWPPTPYPGPYGNWSDVREGYSHRFKTKLPVDFNELDGEQGFDQNVARYEIACLQLQNLENMELLERKERDLQSASLEIEDFRNQMRQSLLVQDELFKQYFEEKAKYEQKMNNLTNENNELYDKNAEVENRVQLLEGLVQKLNKSDPDGLKKELIEYTKKISIQEVNLIRLSRKYDSLKADEKSLREAYHKIEVVHSEKEAELVKRLNELTTWKQKATTQLKVLFELQSNSVPGDQHRLLRSQFEILQEKYSDLRVKESGLLSRVARLETYERDLFTKNELVRDLKEDILEGELESEMLRKRLEELDPTFSKYQAIFRQIVDVIKKKNISPVQIFELIDRNKDGKLGKKEFESALISMQINFDATDLDVLFLFMDIDGTGEIEYGEFLKKLKRSGVKMRSNEEELVFKMYEAITKAKLSLKQAFEIFDKDADNMISKKDMLDTFSAMNFGLTNRVVEEFYAMADVNGDGSINFEEFHRLFENVIKDAFLEEKKGELEELNWKMQIMLKIDAAIKKANLTLLDAFSIIDEDGSGKITYPEFQGLFKKINLELAPSELRGLFDEIDKDHEGTISFLEFQQYFERANRENNRINRLKSIYAKTETLRESAAKSYHEIVDPNNPQSQIFSENQKYSMKIALLETREKNANNRIEVLTNKIKNMDDELKIYDKQIRDLEAQNLKLQGEYYKTREREIKLEQVAQGALPKDQADKLRKLNQKMALDWSDLSASRKTFTKLYEHSVSQVKTLKVAIEKKKNETDVMQTTIKDLQMNSDEHSLIGKLQHELMISKWNEGLVNQKYEAIHDENRRLQMLKEELEVQLQERNDEIVSIHNAYMEKLVNLERAYEETRKKVLPNISVQKLDELGNKIREISHQKSDLEAYNRTLRQEVHDLGVRVDYLETQKKAVEELELRLKKDHSDDISQQLIELSAKLSEYRLAELRAKRDANLLEQKEEYHQRLIRQQTERMKQLEEELSNWEKKYIERENFWRKRYNEQMGIIFKKPGDENASDNHPSLSIGNRDGGVRKDVNYLKETANKNNELKDLRQKLEEYKTTLDNKNHRIATLEDALKKLEQARHDGSVLPQVENTRNIIKDAYNDEEAKKFANAAQKIIQTLQETIEDKNRQLGRKEEMLKRIREENLAHKNQDAEEIQRLNQQIEILMREASNGNGGQPHPMNRSIVDSALIGRVPLVQVEAAMLEKDRKMELLNKEIQNLFNDKKELSDKLQQYRIKNEHLQSELALEREKYEASKVQKEIESLKKQIKLKDQELVGLKKSIEIVKNEYLRINGMSSDKEEEMKNKLKEQSSQQEIQMKLAVQRIHELDDKIKKHEKELKDFYKKDAESREQITLLKEENQKLKADLSEKENALKREKQLRVELTLERDTLKEDKQKVQRSQLQHAASEKEELRQRLEKLERANSLLKSEKSSEFFDDGGQLKEPGFLVFPDSATLYKRIKEWLRLNPKSSLYREFQEFDKMKTGAIRENEIYGALEAVGIKLKSRDQATLLKEVVKKENNEFDYADLYNKIFGIKEFGHTFKSDKLGIKEPENKLGFSSKPRKESALNDKDKTISKNVEVLRNEVANLKKENEKLEKQLQNWKENYAKLDKEYKTLLSKPITKTHEELEGPKKINTLQKLDSIQELRDKVFELENKVATLEKILNTEKEPLIQKLKQNKEKLEEEAKQLKAESLKSRTQVENFYAKKLTPEQLKEEMVYEKDMIITNLKDKLDALRAKEAALEDRLFDLEQKNLELHLDKESHELQMQRLHRRIQELDEFKNTYQELLKNADKAMTLNAKRRT